MKWEFKEIIQETNHPFLNFYTVKYLVTENSGIQKEYCYYLASRHNKEELLVKTQNYTKPDGVIIPLYYIDNNNEISLLLTKQFRPAVGRYVISVPAGLIDEGEDLISSVKREAKEEAGVNVDNIDILSPIGTTSSGLSDETNAIVLARIIDFNDKNLEEFEDINCFLVKLEEIDKILNDTNLFIANTARLIFIYLKERFKNK